MSPRLGELLVQDRASTPEAVQDALRNQVIFGGRLGTNLLEIRGVTEEALSRALGRQHGIASLHGDMRLDPRATALLRPELADRCEAVPYALAERRLAVLVADPKNLAMLDEVAFATGKQVHPVVVPEARIWALLRRTYGIERHLRGIDVDFTAIGARRRASTEEAAQAPAPAEDLMDERAFDALYGRVGDRPARTLGEPAPPPPPPARDDEVIELTDLVREGGAPPAAPPEIVAEVLAALRGPGRAPPSRPAQPPPAAPPAEPEPSPLGFDEAVRALEGVEERNAIAKTVLRYARSRFRRALLLTVHRGAAHGWDGLGEKLAPDRVRRIQLGLDAPGAVDTVVKTRAHFLGPLPRTDANIRLLGALGGGVPGNALLVPILALGRVVNVFYADNGKGGTVDPEGIGELLILATRIAKSYDALVAKVR